MSDLIFYEKPGCMTNRKQKAMLQASGITFEVRDLLASDWTKEQLAGFLKGLPVDEWFNPSSPRIKSGEIVPMALIEDEALDLLLDDHLLIRRPLLERAGRRMAGFDQLRLETVLGIRLMPGVRLGDTPLDQCSRSGTEAHCP